MQTNTQCIQCINKKNVNHTARISTTHIRTAWNSSTNIEKHNVHTHTSTHTAHIHTTIHPASHPPRHPHIQPANTYIIYRWNKMFEKMYKDALECIDLGKYLTLFWVCFDHAILIKPACHPATGLSLSWD